VRRSWAGPAIAAAITAAIALGGMAGAAVPRATDNFPHPLHERLFPVCESCHRGITGDTSGPAYPAPADCARCHDGARLDRVDWQQPAARASNLRFSHAQHLALAAAADTAPACQACHALDGGTGRMAVGAAAPERCIGCHEHQAPAHLDQRVRCARCHVDLRDAAGLAGARIARFPRPAWHEAPDFLSSHATTAAPADASCGVCHARETCERCHANAEDIQRIRLLSRDERVAALETGRRPAYPVPADHAARDWASKHGAEARARPARCANCHTQPSCTVCHAGARTAAVQALPPLRPGAAPGVDPGRINSRVHTPDVHLDHGRLAASGRLECAQCHTRAQCASCHAAVESRAFHLPNFVERHAVEVFAGRGECQACHSTETFCRACHTRTGVAAQAMNAAFHDGQPMWVLSHGQAARRGLEACASCHRQSDCIACHSAAGGWGVSPHGPGFTGRGETRSAASCRLCHPTNPRRGG
jgi:hypothetical protein